MDDDAEPFFIEISVSRFSIGNQDYFSLNKMISLLLSQFVYQKILLILYKHCLEEIQHA